MPVKASKRCSGISYTSPTVAKRARAKARSSASLASFRAVRAVELSPMATARLGMARTTRRLSSLRARTEVEIPAMMEM